MKVQLILLAGTMAGLTLVATPVLSQDRPDSPMTRPPTTPGQDRMTGTTDFKQAMRMLEGSWQITVKTFEGGAEANNQMQGTSTRRWVLNQNILQEDVRTSGSAGGNFQVREPGTPQTRPGSALGAGFEGHGMFGFDAASNEFQHVWADSMDSKLAFSTGRYDERTRTLTFNKQRSGMTTTPPRTTPPVTTPPSTTPPSTTPPPRPGAPGTIPGTPDPDDDLRMQATAPGQPTTPPPSRPSTPGATQRPGGSLDLINVDRVVIRIQDDNKHVVEYYGAGQNKVMEITYTKGAAGATSR